MSDVFISYARSGADQAQAVARALRSLGYEVWLDDEIPAHRAYGAVIEERLKAAKAVVVIWSADAVKSQWVQSEADRARDDGKLIQLSFDNTRLPMPFDRIQCADMAGWSGEVDAPGWRKVVASIADLVGERGASPVPTATLPPPLPSKPSITVLPFANLSGDPEQDYFADGMVEEITRALSRFKSLFVIGAGSGLSFKGKATTPQDAARSLGVRYALEGSVRKAGGRVRIAVKLIDAADGAQIWSDRFEDTLEDVFALQDKVALGVASAIESALRQAETRRASARPAEIMSSDDLFLHGLTLSRTGARADVWAALELFDRAIAFDPGHGSALATAAICHASIIANGWSDDPEGHASAANSLMQRALKAGGDDPAVLCWVAGATLMIGGDLETAAALVDRAMVLNPGASVVWAIRAQVLIRSGEPQLAFDTLETALRLDPLSKYRPVWLGTQGTARFAQERFAEAVTLLKQSAQLLPDSLWVHALLAASYGHLGERSAAREAIGRFRSGTSMAIGDWAARYPPDFRKLFVDGIDLAEGKARFNVADRGDQP